MACQLLSANPISSLCLHVQKILSIIHPNNSQKGTSRCHLDCENAAEKGPPALAWMCQMLEHRLSKEHCLLERAREAAMETVP